MERTIRRVKMKKILKAIKKWFSFKKSIEKEEILWIIKNGGKLGVSELAYGKLLVKFSPNASSSNIPQESQTSPTEDTNPINTQTDEDSDLVDATLGIDDPSAFMEKLEHGEMEFAEFNDNATGEDLQG